MSSISNTAFATPLSLSARPQTLSSTTLIASRSASSPLKNVSVARSHRSARMMVDLRDQVTKEKEIAEAELQAVTDPAPGPYAFFAERINGQAAMAGFFIGLLVEITTGTTINQQIGLIFKGLGMQGFLFLAPFIEIISQKAQSP